MGQVILGLLCREAITKHKKVMMDYVLTECWKMFWVIYLMQFAALKATDKFLQQLRPTNFFVIQVVEIAFCSRCGHELCWDVRELRKEVLQNCSIGQVGRRFISSI